MAVAPLHAGFLSGTVIKVKLVPGRSRFRIDLRYDNNPHTNDNIALHFNPRWDDPTSGRVVVRNSMVGGAWGREERDGQGGFPFETGKSSTMYFIVTEHFIRVVIDGRHYCSFAHREPNWTNIRFVTVDGDAHKVEVQVL